MEPEKNRSIHPSSARNSAKGGALPTISTIQVLPVQPPVFKINFQVDISQILNLNLVKAPENDEWTAVIKLFHISERPLAVSDSVPVINPTGEMHVSLNVMLDVSTWGDIDNLVAHPLLINIYEMEVIRDKKKQTPEEKMELVGQCACDLLPFALGAVDVTHTCPVFHPSRKSAGTGSPRASEPENSCCTVKVRTNEPAIPKIPFSAMLGIHVDHSPAQDSCEILGEYAALLNILTISIEGGYSLPSNWLTPTNLFHPGSGLFTVVLNVPSTGDRQRLLTVPNKVLEILPETAKPLMKKWPSSPLQMSDMVHMDVLFPGKSSSDLSAVPAESDAKRPGLNICTEFRCALAPDAEENLRTKLTSSKAYPVELFSLVYPEKHPGTKKKPADGPGSTSDEPTIARHGVAYVDLKSLLLPGEKIFSGAVPLRHFNSIEFPDLTNQPKPSAYELYAAPVPGSSQAENDRTLSSQKKLPDPLSSHNLRKSLPSALPSQETVAQSASRSQDTEVDIYATYGSYIFLRVSLLKPLIPKKSRNFSMFSVKDMVRCHPGSLFPNDNGLAAMEDFRNQVQRCREQISELYRTEQKLGHEWNSLVQNVERKFAESGQLLVAKSTLKRQILNIVRDRFFRHKPFAGSEEYQDYLADLYSALVREINVALQKPVEETDSLTARDPWQVDSHLQILALEAKLNGDQEKAEELMKSRVKGDKDNRFAWKELGLFYLSMRKLQDAQVSFTEFLLGNMDDPDALLLLAYTYYEQGTQDQAHIYFEAVCSRLPNSVVAHTALGLYYESLPDDGTGAVGLLKSRAYYQANKLLGIPDDRLKSYRKEIRDQECLFAGEIPTFSSGPEAVHNAQKNLCKFLYPRRPSAARMSYPGSRKVLPASELLISHKDIQMYEIERSPAASEQKPWKENIFWYSLPYFAQASMFRFATKCMAKLTGVCPVSDPDYWRSSVKLLLASRQHESAQQILSQLEAAGEESAHFYVQCGHLKYFQKEFNNAATLYEQALGSNVEQTDAFALYYRYGTLSASLCNHRKARKMFHAAATLHSTSYTWTGCGIASYHLGDFVDAEYALKKALALDRENGTVWGYLALVSHQIGDDNSCRRYLRHARRIGVQDPRSLEMLNKLSDELNSSGDHMPLSSQKGLHGTQ